MKKNLIIITLLLICIFSGFSQSVTAVSPVFYNSRQNAIGGYHVADTTDFFTIFANPAGIPLVEEQKLWVGFDTKIVNPELLVEFFSITYDALFGEGVFNSLEMSQDLVGLIGEQGVNLGFETIGPLAFGSISDSEYGTFGWTLFGKTKFTGFVPTLTHIDAYLGFDNVFQLSYAAPIIENDVHYLSTGISSKGIFIFDTGVTDEEPLGLATHFYELTSILPLYTRIGYSWDVGLYYDFLGFFSAGLVWHDIFNVFWNQSYSLESVIESAVSLTLPGSSTSSFQGSTGTLDIGIAFDIPLGIVEKVITEFIIMADYKDLLMLLSENPAKKNPILNLSLGTELTLFDILSLRAGINESYLSAGAGVNFGGFVLDFALFGSELGLEPGSIPQLNASLAFSIHY